METLNFQEAGKYFRKHYINLQSWKQIRCTRGSAKCQGYGTRSEEHTSELQSQSNLVCRLLLEKTKQVTPTQGYGMPPGPVSLQRPCRTDRPLRPGRPRSAGGPSRAPSPQPLPGTTGALPIRPA